MALQFSTLASGSRGNAALIRSAGAGLLIDLGLGPRSMAARLSAVGASWDGIAAVLLTHTHGDHVGDAGLRWLSRRGIPLYCHEGHRGDLGRFRGFEELGSKGLLRPFDDRPFLAPTGLRVEPVPLLHDGGPTFGFRVEGREGRRSRPASIGYVADTGCWWEAMADALADVDLLGIEFNHDVEMQRRSGRSWALISRNLGDRGHLSNAQGADLLRAVLDRSHSGSIRQVILLHLSEQCNRPDLAVGAALVALREAGRRATVLVAPQWSATPGLPVAPGRRRLGRAAAGFPWEAA